jgi:hypothetical protein
MYDITDKEADMKHNFTEVLAMMASITLLSGCAVTALPNVGNNGFKWMSVGTNAQGCEMFTKQSTSPNVVVDSAIWYRDTNGHYTLNADTCVPSSNGAKK